jgi:hypothetical protein
LKGPFFTLYLSNYDHVTIIDNQKNITMKTKIITVFSAVLLILLTSCKRDNISVFQVDFTGNGVQGMANANGEYTLTGHIFSGVSLSHVTLTREGESEVFMVDEATAKNKNEYDFSYLVTHIDANTTIIMDVYDQIGGRYSTQFFILK